MLTNEEMTLSKTSYIDKDFRSIYPNLLDLVKQLTNRWDPSSSNESDPGVVLLKVGAFLADHLNYNIDKNILEAFLPSATQEESVRRIAEFGGYTPRYYRSAIGNVSVAYNPKGEFPGAFILPAFSLIISNDDGSITYTQLDSMTFGAKNVPATGGQDPNKCRFIEGTLQRLAIDSDVITLNNIDNYRRLYFPNQYIAENGIFIYNVNKSGQRLGGDNYDWKKTNYIYTQPLGTRCYKIDFDSSKGLPYIEFPTDISNLIEDGLAIYYIYTAGSYGNVKAGELNTIVSVSTNALSDIAKEAVKNTDDFIIINNSSISNGCEPESIEEIYNSYKKVVGTFDTLVSIQDYSNAIRTAENNVGELYVSNGLMTDRRTDYNNAVNVLSSKVTGSYFTNVALNFGNLTFLTTKPSDDDAKKGNIYYEDNKAYLCTSTNPVTWTDVTDKNLDSGTINEYLNGMSPYDLTIYALQKYYAQDYNSIYYWKALANSFKQIDGDADKANDTIGTEDNLIAALDELKCINHTYKDLDDGQIYCFKNYVPLNVDIIPYNKVTKYERFEIINNIRKAISDNFNASKVEFGEELNYDVVKKVIEDADARINYVRLSDFEYNTKVMLKDSRDQLNAEELDLFDEYEGSSFIVDLAAKNVLAGRLCLFEFDDNFDYKYGQNSTNIYTDIAKIETKTTITPDQDSEGYYIYNNHTLQENEYLEIFYPRYYSDKTYGSYVLYNLNLVDNDKVIKAGVEYELQTGETLDLYYKDSDNNVFKPHYEAGTIINASFDLKDFENDSRTTYTKEDRDYKQLASSENISTRILLDTVLSTPTYVYWILNDSSNNLFVDGDNSPRVLESGEFFIYTDSSKTNLTILGRGTKLQRQSDDGTWALPEASSSKITQAQLGEEGLAARIPFINLDALKDNPLTLTEMNIVTLGEGDSFSLTCSSDKIDYNLIENANNISYVVDGVTTTLPEQDNFYSVRARLDLNVSKDSPMILREGQQINIKDETGRTTEKTIEGNGLIIQSNVDLSLIGNVNSNSLDLSVYSDLGIGINWMTYVNENESGTRIAATNEKVQPDTANAWICSPDHSEYLYIGATPATAYINTWYICNEESIDSSIQYSYNLSEPLDVKIPFSVAWYDYLSNSEAVIDREYICQIYLANPNNQQGKVQVSILNTDGTEVELGYYGRIDKDGANYYLLNNNSIYVYPKITADLQDVKNLILHLTTNGNPIDGAIMTIVDPKVTWGVNGDLGARKDSVISRMNDLLNNSSNNKVQFYWVSNPNSDIAMTVTDLTDPYSLFDHNNVANIITIPEIDLENSNIEIIRSMRNY